MRKGCIISLWLFTIICCLLVYGFLHAFDTQYSKADIQQNIGGVLLCDASLVSDQHSWQYDVNYNYKDKIGRIHKIGTGTYFEREWQRNEQFIRLDKWIILKTGGEFHCDKLIIGNLYENKFVDYEFNTDNITKDPVWQKLNIDSHVGWLPEEAYITKITNGQIDVLYKFRLDDKKVDLLGEKKIIYQIDLKSGEPVMIKVVDISK
jgi:hypothetical protein